MLSLLLLAAVIDNWSFSSFSILADLNNALVKRVSILPLISSPSSFYSKLVRTVVSAPLIFDITVTVISLLLLLLLFTPLEFFHISVNWWFFTEVWVTASLLKSPGLVLRILAVLNNAVVWIVSTRPPTSKSSGSFNNPLVTVPNASITIGTIVTFMFHSFFNSLAKSRYLSFLSFSFRFILWSAGTAKCTILQILFFCWLLWGLVFWPRIRWSICMLKSHRSLCESFSRTK